MRPFRQSGSDHLSRYWTAVVTGADPDEISRLARHLDPVMVATIAHMRSAALESLPGPTFVQQLETRLMASHAPSLATSPHIPRTPAATNRRPATAMLRQEPRWWPALAVATVLIVIIGAVAAIRILDERDSGPSRGAPAIQAPGTPAPDATADQTLLELTLPAELVPHSDERHAALAHETVPPGVTSTWTPTAASGAFIQYIVSGSVVVRVDAGVQVRRADGSAEDPPADTEVTLTAGDTLITRLEYAMETTNPGEAPAETLNVFFLDDPGDLFSGRAQTGWKVHLVAARTDVSGDLADFPDAVTIRLQRVALGPDERIESLPARAHLEVVLDGVTESILRTSDDRYLRASNSKGEPTTTLYLVTLTPAEAGAVATPTLPLGYYGA